jgi:hypothetical protein
MQHVAHMELSKINRGLLLENRKKTDYLENPCVKEKMIFNVILLDGFLLTDPRTGTSCGLLSIGFHEVTILSSFIDKISASLERLMVYGVSQTELFLYLTEVENYRRLLSF